MGLDQYAYAALRAGQREDFYGSGTYENGVFSNAKIPEPDEIAYWRKHPNLQGWMERLWHCRGRPGSLDADTVFNCIELELTIDDINQLEADIQAGTVAELGTQGFFFGHPSDDHYREHDLDFCREARFRLMHGFRVFYNSSW